MGDDGQAVNASLALVQGIKPTNEVEAALAAQMAAIHRLSLRCAAIAGRTSGLQTAQTFGGLAVKLTRTFATQIEALAKLRSGGKQQVEVKYVYVNGNAVVGNVHGAGGGVEQGNPEQPLATDVASLPFAPGVPMPGVLAPDREAVPGTGCEGPHAMPYARRRGGIGSPDG